MAEIAWWTVVAAKAFIFLSTRRVLVFLYVLIVSAKELVEENRRCRFVLFVQNDVLLSGP